MFIERERSGLGGTQNWICDAGHAVFQALFSKIDEEAVWNSHEPEMGMELREIIGGVDFYGFHLDYDLIFNKEIQKEGPSD